MNRSLPESQWPLRSLLFVPAHRIEWVRKTALSGVDAVILDLEDAVPPSQKAAARALIAEEIDILSKAGIAPFVRVNYPGDACQEDQGRERLAGSGAGPDQRAVESEIDPRPGPVLGDIDIDLRHPLAGVRDHQRGVVAEPEPQRVVDRQLATGQRQRIGRLD